MEKFIEYLQEAEKKIKNSDHIVYVTIPLVKDKKLILKILEEIKKAVAYIINSILQYEYVFKKINLSKDAKTNFQTFIQKSSKRFDITKEEITEIIDLFEIAEAHKHSPMEFPRKEKIIILKTNMNHISLNLEKIKKFLFLSKNLLKKVKSKITLH